MQLDLTESQKIYLPIAELSAQKQAAREAWGAADKAYQTNPTPENRATLVRTCEEFKEIDKKFVHVETVRKHNAGTVKSIEVPYV